MLSHEEEEISWGYETERLEDGLWIRRYMGRPGMDSRGEKEEL